MPETYTCDPRTGCFRGILKSCFKWNDTLECFKGSSEVGANQCYLEYHVAIDQYKERGINVATYNDSLSNTVYLEYICLVLLLVFMNFLIYMKAWLVNRGLNRHSNSGMEPRRRLSRRDSITNVILSRFDNEENEVQGNSFMRSLRRLSSRISLSSSVTSRFQSNAKDEAEAVVASNSEDIPVDETTPTPQYRRDSLRTHTMKRLQSSNVLTWK